MKNVLAKYAASILTATMLMVTPVISAPLSGSQLLDRFDRLHALPLLAEFHAGAAYYDEESKLLEEDEIEEGDFIIIIVEEELPSDAYDYTDEKDYAEYPYEEEYIIENYTVPGFAISSGINRRSESTFDTARTIVGTAPRGTLVRIEVFGYHEASDSFYKVSGSVLTVGASGNFSSVQQLSLGHNFIRIKALYNDYRSESSYISIETAQVNRIPNAIRSQLERGLLLP